MEPVTLRVGARSDVGRKRSLNEDSFLAQAPVFLVADGMGGHDAGEVASAAVVQAFSPLVGVPQLQPGQVVSAVQRAHQIVAGLSRTQRHGAGSTLTGAALLTYQDAPHWMVFNVGDSRTYRYFGSRLSQITVDHSLVQEMVDQGLITAEQAHTSRQRNVITRAVGAPDSAPDFWMVPVTLGERLLLCSDGLTGEVPDEKIGETLMLGGGPQETADSLVNQAIESGGRDNVTVIVVDVVGGRSVRGFDATAGSSSTSELLLSDLEESTIPKG